MSNTGELRSYECSLDGEHWVSFMATSRGKAKSKFMDYLEGCYEPEDYLCVKTRVTSKPQTSMEFRRNAKYRGIDFAHYGMKVEVSGDEGVIVGHNNSANLDILFTKGKWKDRTLNCHPNWDIKYFDSEGKLIREYGREH